MLKPTLAQIKAAEAEMNERLTNIPLALSNPYGRALALEKELSALEKTIKRLKAFVEFLKNLNPTKYLEWFQRACAGYVPPKKTPKTAAMPVAPTSINVVPQASLPSTTLPKPVPQKP